MSYMIFDGFIVFCTASEGPCCCHLLSFEGLVGVSFQYGVYRGALNVLLRGLM